MTTIDLRSELEEQYDAGYWHSTYCTITRLDDDNAIPAEAFQNINVEALQKVLLVSPIYVELSYFDKEDEADISHYGLVGLVQEEEFNSVLILDATPKQIKRFEYGTGIPVHVFDEERQIVCNLV